MLWYIAFSISIRKGKKTPYASINCFVGKTVAVGGKRKGKRKTVHEKK